MSEALSDLIGQQVTVVSTSVRTAYRDEGRLESYDHPWLRLQKDSGQVIWFSVYNIRLVELRYGRFEDLSADDEQDESLWDDHEPTPE